MKKLLYTLLFLGLLSAFGLIASAAPVFAFEGHVISVTATIGNHEAPDKDLSNWVLGLCDPDHTDSTVIGTYPEYEEGVHTDPNSGIYGIKWEQQLDKEKGGATYVVELDGFWELGEVPVAVKAASEQQHDGVAVGSILGPSCTELDDEPQQPDVTDHVVLAGWKIKLIRATYQSNGGNRTFLEYWVGPADQDAPLAYADIALNEFLADPSGDETLNEWVELFKLGGSSRDLDGWTLYDEVGHDLIIDSSYTSGGSTTINSQDNLIINRNNSSFSLNNDGDAIYLYDDEKADGGQLIAMVRYWESIEDKSWARNDGPAPDTNGYGVWVDPYVGPPEVEDQTVLDSSDQGEESNGEEGDGGSAPVQVEEEKEDQTQEDPDSTPSAEPAAGKNKEEEDVTAFPPAEEQEQLPADEPDEVDPQTQEDSQTTVGGPDPEPDE